jgi:hypothetical protein
LQDGRADQYALAAMAYEMLAGRLPFDVADERVLRQCVLNDEPSPIPSIPDHVNAALAKALSKRREDRFESCVAFVRALASPRKSQPAAPAVPAPPSPATTPAPAVETQEPPAPIMNPTTAALDEAYKPKVVIKQPAWFFSSGGVILPVGASHHFTLEALAHEATEWYAARALPVTVKVLRSWQGNRLTIAQEFYDTSVWVRDRDDKTELTVWGQGFTNKAVKEFLVFATESCVLQEAATAALKSYQDRLGDSTGVGETLHSGSSSPVAGNPAQPSTPAPSMATRPPAVAPKAPGQGASGAAARRQSAPASPQAARRPAVAAHSAAVQTEAWSEGARWRPFTLVCIILAFLNAVGGYNFAYSYYLMMRPRAAIPWILSHLALGVLLYCIGRWSCRSMVLTMGLTAYAIVPAGLMLLMTFAAPHYLADSGDEWWGFMMYISFFAAMAALAQTSQKKQEHADRCLIEPLALRRPREAAICRWAARVALAILVIGPAYGIISYHLR